MLEAIKLRDADLLVTAQVNVNNLFDKYYFTGNFASGGATSFATVNPGAPRSVLASLRFAL